MTTIEAVRAAFLEDIEGLLTRPGMLARNGGEAEMLLWQTVRKLALIDGRDSTWFTELCDRHGKLGLTGPFRAAFGEGATYRPEVVSIAAQAFAIAGYAIPERSIAVADWSSFCGDLRERLEDQDMRRVDLHAELGPASYSIAMVDGPWDAIVDGYMCEGDPGAWAFLDYWQQTDRDWYRPASQSGGAYVSPDDGWLRDVRLPARRWDDGFVLSAFGKHLRWGPGWRLHYARDGRDGYPAGVGDQLRASIDEDPSQTQRSN